MGRNAGKGKRGYAGGTSRGHAGNTRRNNPGKIRGGTGGTYQGSADKRRGSTKKSAGSRRRRIFAFLIFQFVFALITMPLLIFYGPFEEVRGTLVGASWNTLNHRYIARFFLSDEAITRIIRSSFADDPTARGETLQKLDLSGGHDSTIEVYNIEGRDFEGKLMVVHDPAG